MFTEKNVNFQQLNATIKATNLDLQLLKLQYPQLQTENNHNYHLLVNLDLKISELEQILSLGKQRRQKLLNLLQQCKGKITNDYV